MMKVVPTLGVTILDENLAPIKKINISVAAAAFFITEENSPKIVAKIIVKQMKNINGVDEIREISGEVVNYDNIIYYDLDIFSDKNNSKIKIEKVEFSISEGKIINDENLKYGISSVPFGIEEGTLINNEQIAIINDTNIFLKLDDFNIILGEVTNEYVYGVHIRFKVKLLENIS